jgi:hypothetical protein
MANLGDIVELTIDMPDKGLRVGMQGTIVHCHVNQAYEVEFTNDEGETLDFMALRPEQFIVVWRAKTQQWVPASEHTSAKGKLAPLDLRPEERRRHALQTL